MSLTQYFRSNTGLPINKWIHYLPIYERYFSAYRDRRIVFLEIGTGQGGSSQMWKNYFGPLARIVTVDIRPECKKFEDEQIAVRVGDQSDPNLLKSIIDEFGAPDVVLDDGSHVQKHINETFDYLYLRMPREALYMVEDTHTAYWPGYGGGLRNPSTFIERMKGLIDELHADNPHSARQGGEQIQASGISRVTRGIHFYDSIVVIEKGEFLTKAARSIPFIKDQTIW